MMNIEMEIRKKAKELGFELFGIADVAVDKGDCDFFREWLAAGEAANMEGWLGRGAEKRCHPEQILPGVRSLLVVGMNYYPGDHDADEGLVARYAWGDDYHEVMGEKLEELAKEIGGEAKWYVDTGAVFERYFAVKAGLGFIGKNTCLISKDFGSWVFLGVILTTAELEPSRAQAIGSCGDCRKCIDACPTGALSEKNLDARKCISYLTIEKKGDFSEDEKKLVAGQKFCFGCDVCQEVCPHNVRSKKTLSFSPRIQDLGLEDLKGFEKKFNKSPLKRAKKEGLYRNLTSR